MCDVWRSSDGSLEMERRSESAVRASGYSYLGAATAGTGGGAAKTGKIAAQSRCISSADQAGDAFRASGSTVGAVSVIGDAAANNIGDAAANNISDAAASVSDAAANNISSAADCASHGTGGGTGNGLGEDMETAASAE